MSHTQPSRPHSGYSSTTPSGNVGQTAVTAAFVNCGNQVNISYCCNDSSSSSSDNGKDCDVSDLSAKVSEVSKASSHAQNTTEITTKAIDIKAVLKFLTELYNDKGPAGLSPGEYKELVTLIQHFNPNQKTSANMGASGVRPNVHSTDPRAVYGLAHSGSFPLSLQSAWAVSDSGQFSSSGQPSSNQYGNDSLGYARFANTSGGPMAQFQEVYVHNQNSGNVINYSIDGNAKTTKRKNKRRGA